MDTSPEAPPPTTTPAAPTTTPAGPATTPRAPEARQAPGQGFRALTDRWTRERVEQIVALMHAGDRAALARYLEQEVPRVPHATDPPDTLDLKGLRFDRLGYRADLGGVSLEGMNLWSSRFGDVNMKGARFARCAMGLSKFEGVYMRDAVFDHCDLHGCDFTRTNLQRVRFERTALRFTTFTECEVDIGSFAQGLEEERLGKWALARDIYKALRLNLNAGGDDAGAGWAVYRESVMLRRDMLARGRRAAWLGSVVLDVLWGYGQRPTRLLFFSILFCVLCAGGYFALGLRIGDQCLTGAGRPDPLGHFFECLYFSFVTFTTVGYGDLTPCGFSRVLAATQAFSGIFTMGLFVTANVRKLEGR
jgi:hypothetical protein